MAYLEKFADQDLDLLVGVGGSHLGGLFLYDSRDEVARFDYHSDFENMARLGRNYLVNYATYMDHVKYEIPPKEVYNYFVKTVGYKQ